MSSILVVLPAVLMIRIIIITVLTQARGNDGLCLPSRFEGKEIPIFKF